MMFSSDQVLQYSGPLDNVEYLRNALEFALKASGDLEVFTRNDNPGKCTYQILDDGRYCIGWHEISDIWKEYPFDFDLDIISRIIVQHLEKQEVEYGIGDGSYEKGFLMSAISRSFSNENDGIKRPFYGIVEFRPYTCFYSK